MTTRDQIDQGVPDGPVRRDLGVDIGNMALGQRLDRRVGTPPVAPQGRQAGDAGDGDRPARPMTFIQAALFQWVNGKAWYIAGGAISTYTTVGGNMMNEIGIIAAIFIVVCYGALSIWALFGLAIGRLLTSTRARTAFNWTMAGLLVVSLVPLLA